MAPKEPFVGGNFFEHNGLPYCETHYHAMRGSLCAGCHKPISGRCITAMFRKFHPEHFLCSFCLKQVSQMSTEACKIIPAYLKIPTPSAARQLDQPCTAQSANFGKLWLNSQNLAGTILHHSVQHTVSDKILFTSGHLERNEDAIHSFSSFICLCIYDCKVSDFVHQTSGMTRQKQPDKWNVQNDSHPNL